MKTITKNVYEFKELKEDVKEKVLDDLRETNMNYEWWDCNLMDISEQIKEKINIDIESKDIFFDFGNGCNIYIEDNVVERALLSKYSELISLDLPNKFGCFTNYMGGGLNSNLKNSDFDLEYAEFEESDFEDELRKAVYQKSLDEIKSKIETDLEQLHNVLEKGFKDLWEQHNHLLSDESIIQTIECNEYEFYEDGERA